MPVLTATFLNLGNEVFLLREEVPPNDGEAPADANLTPLVRLEERGVVLTDIVFNGEAP